MSDTMHHTGERPPGTDGRERILDAAAELFVRHGYAATSLRHIAAAADMKAGSLYYHFEGKDDLLAAVLRRGIEVMELAFEQAAEHLSETAGSDRARARVHTHVRAHLAALFEHGPYTAAHVTTFHTAPREVRDAIVLIRDSYEARWTDLLEDLAGSGQLAPGTPVGLTRLVLFGAMNSTIDWFDIERGSLDDLATTIAEQFWRGVRR